MDAGKYGKEVSSQESSYVPKSTYDQKALPWAVGDAPRYLAPKNSVRNSLATSKDCQKHVNIVTFGNKTNITNYASSSASGF